MNNNRRRLLQGSLGLGLPTWAMTDALAQQGLAAAGGFDLVIFGGRVIDPSQNIDKVADVAIKNGRVALIQTAIDPTLAAQKIDEYLKILNDDYRVERLEAIRNVTAEILPTNVFYSWMATHNKIGSQNKFPRVLKTSKLLDWEEFIKQHKTIKN